VFGTGPSSEPPSAMNSELVEKLASSLRWTNPGPQSFPRVLAIAACTDRKWAKVNSEEFQSIDQRADLRLGLCIVGSFDQFTATRTMSARAALQ